MINHVVVLTGFYSRSYAVRSATTTQFCFRRRSHLYDQSHSCPISFSSKWTLDLIGHVVLSDFHHILHPIRFVTKVQYHFQSGMHLYNWSRCCPIQFSSQTTLSLIGHDSLVSFSTQNTPTQSVMSLSCLVFVTYHTRFNRSQQFSFNFCVDQTFMINHIILLLSFIHRSCPI